MSKKIVHLNEGAIKEELKELVRGSVEEMYGSFGNKRDMREIITSNFIKTSALKKTSFAFLPKSPFFY